MPMRSMPHDAGQLARQDSPAGGLAARYWRVCVIGQRAQALLEVSGEGEVTGVFATGCYLMTRAGDMLTLSSPQHPRGPLALLTPDFATAMLAPGLRWSIGERWPRSTLGPAPAPHSLSLGMAQAAVWDARLPWRHLGRKKETARCRAADLETQIIRHAAAKMTLSRCKMHGTNDWLDRARAVLASDERGGHAARDLSIRQLCGLGPGLTPAGDDWLAGWLLGLNMAVWPAAPTAQASTVLDAAEARTTSISRAFLQCAACGEADEVWHRLAGGLTSAGGSMGAEEAAASILGRGATSGLATLYGFLAALGHGRRLEALLRA